MGLLKISRRVNEIHLPSGVKCKVSELVAKHQGILTQKKTKHIAKIRAVLVDVIQDIDGVDWKKMDDKQKNSFVKKMLDADVFTILAEARQLAQARTPYYVYSHEYKSDNGTKLTEKFKINFIDKDNQEEIIQNILKDYSPEDEALIRSLNRTGCFPTRPYRKRFDSYKDVLDNLNVEFEVSDERLKGVKFRFTLPNFNSAEDISNKEAVNSNTFLQTCKLSMWHEPESGKGKPHWVRLEPNDIEKIPVGVIAEISAKINKQLGLVDSVDYIEFNGENIYVNVLLHSDFFFPTGEM